MNRNPPFYYNIALLFVMAILLMQFIGVPVNQNGNTTLMSQDSQAYSTMDYNDISSPSNSPINLSDYTLLVYMVGSDLESEQSSATDDLIEMRKGGNPSNINIIIQTGGGGGNITSPSDGIKFIDLSKVQRHQIVNGSLHTLMDLGHKNMGEPSTLSDFIKWGVLEYPAKKYAIILWDHGSGLNGFGRDVMFRNDILTPVELRSAFLTAKSQLAQAFITDKAELAKAFRGANTFLTGKPGTILNFELVGFDACLMSSLEIASRLQNVTNYMVSSQELEPTWGWDYTAIIKNLTADWKQSGRSLGIAIGDSFLDHSRNISKSEKYGADKDITLSVIDMSKIPKLLEHVNQFSKAMSSTIDDLSSAINLSRSIDLTEHYGQSARASSGLVDLYDLMLNIQSKYPGLSEEIELVQNSLNAASIREFNGVARPNANGLSIYMPLLKDEFRSSAELFAIDLDWMKLLFLQRYLINGDTQPPIIKSTREGDTIKARVYGTDVSGIFAQIVTEYRGHNFMYTQNTEPSLIDDQGFLSYKEHKMLVLCNENECTPSTVNLEINRDNKSAFIPVRLQSKDINANVSLIYQLDKQDNFQFLGATPEINPDETIPKGKFGLTTGDKIFTKALPSRPDYKPAGEITGQGLRDISSYLEGESLTVKDPQKIQPRYIYLNSPHAISFTICDYSDNCDKTRWYNYDDRMENTSLLSTREKSGPEILPEEETSTSPPSTSGLSTYVNPALNFKLHYPSSWIKQGQNIYDNTSLSDDTFADPAVVSFVPPDDSLSTGIFPKKISVSVTDWPFKESPKSLFEFFNNTATQDRLSDNYEIIYSNDTVIAGNPAFKFRIKYVSESEKFLGSNAGERTEEITTILMGNRMYTIDFGSYSPQFYRLLPIANDIINSFEPYKK